jgi:DNA repair exonuclease SbcCD ATPase subunit
MLKLKTTAVPKKIKKAETPLEKAKELVASYEELRGELTEKQKAFEEEFEEAAQALEDIKKTEDEVRALIEVAKTAVREAGQSVGDFKYTAKATSPTYDGAKLLTLLAESDPKDAGEVLQELKETGLVTGFVIDREVGKVIKTTRKDLAELIEDAWDAGGAAMTPAISTPKL